MADSVVTGRRHLPMTEERKQRFLDALRETGGLRRASALMASPHCKTGDGALSSYRRAMERDPDFKAAVEEAEQAGIAEMEREIVGLIRHGWVEQESPTHGPRLKRSERLMELWLKAKCPEYREANRIAADVRVERGVELNLGELSDEQLAQLQTAMDLLAQGQSEDE